MTTSPAVTLIVSDLHMGGGAADPGDDFVYQGTPFEHFVDEQRAGAEGQRGHMELILNGDAFELAQVRPDVYGLGSAQYWCSKDESIEKLKFVMAGHPGVFDALQRFVAAGNALTLAAGNHDIELYWPQVQELLRERIGPLQFELNEEWYTRYDGLLAIAHGHMLDPANRFEHWCDPILKGPDGPRLEMCPGTLFMVKFVNGLEREFPFADNLHPVTALAGILAKDSAGEYAAVAWMLASFAMRHPSAIQSADDATDDYGTRLRRAILDDAERFEEFASAYRQAVDPTASDETVRARLNTPDGPRDCFLDLMGALPLTQWRKLASAPVSTLSLDEGNTGHTLSIVESGRQDAAKVLRDAADERFKTGAAVVVMGHTHQPDMLRRDKVAYYNPGSWTRYFNAANIGLLTLHDLKTEQNFPYQLNYVRVEPDGSGGLASQMITVKEEVGPRFGQRLNL